jgi:KAP-like P-loop domain-containing protein/TIR domain-containing protein
MELRLITDQAIGEAHAHHSDGLGFNTYARVLAQSALDTPGPFTIGVFGEWGTGKTSLMRLIQSQLEGESNVVTVWFNAWRYEKEEHPIVPLIGTIVYELETHRVFSQKFGDSTRRLVRALRAVAYGFSIKSKVSIPGLAEAEASFVAKDMIDRKEGITPDPLLDRSLYYGAFNNLESLHLDRELRVVILVDDLDRCFPDQAIRLLESIKLVLAQRGFIFVLGVARQVIEGYLQHRYSSDFGISDFKGQLYLDKMVQLPFHIPPSAGRMTEFCSRILDHQPADIANQLSEILPPIAEALGGNPRAVIRFVNNILVDLAINSELADAQLMERVPLDYFAISRCLEDRWPEVYAPLVSSTEFASEVASWDLSSVASRAEKTGPEARVAASLVSDQRLAELLFGGHGRSWLGNPELRIASVGFLQTQRRTSPLDTAEAPATYDAWLSYQPGDRPQVVEVAQAMSEVGLRVFFEVNSSPDSNWAQELKAAMGKCLSFCVFIGKEPPSQGHTAEVEMAQRAEKRIVPTLLPGAATRNIPPELSGYPLLDLRQGITKKDVTDFARIARWPLMNSA